jgi:hypothetical protein
MSLCVYKLKNVESDSYTDSDNERHELYIERVVEQRVTNTAQGLLILGTMSGPILKVLGLIPQAVLAGLFWMMGISGLMGNEVIARVHYIFNEDKFNPDDSPFRKASRKYFYAFVLLECLGTGAEVAITETIAAVGFPGVLILLVIVGYFLPRFIPKSDLEILDGPTGSEFILENLTIAEGGDPDSTKPEPDTEEIDLPIMEPSNKNSQSAGLRRRESHSAYR